MSSLDLPPTEMRYQQSHAYQNLSRNLGGFYIILVIFTFLAVVLRILSRRIMAQGLGADDWTFIAGAVRLFLVSDGRVKR